LRPATVTSQRRSIRFLQQPLDQQPHALWLDAAAENADHRPVEGQIVRGAHFAAVCFGVINSSLTGMPVA
jgi:hypothetical protein